MSDSTLAKAALYSLHLAQRGEAGGEKDNLQKQIYTDFQQTG
jgi:hypothetical protein